MNSRIRFFPKHPSCYSKLLKYVLLSGVRKLTISFDHMQFFRGKRSGRSAGVRPASEIGRSCAEQHGHLFKVFKRDICDGPGLILIDGLFSDAEIFGDIVLGETVDDAGMPDPFACLIHEITFFIYVVGL